MRSPLALIGVLALVAIMVSSASVHNDKRMLTAQTGSIPVKEFTAEQATQGVVLEKNTHNFFICHTGGNIAVEANSLRNVRTWAYEFTGNEPPFNGKFFISNGEIAANSKYNVLNTLTSFSEDKRYYQMGEADLFFMCGSGLSPLEFCGDTVISDTEECDDGNDTSHDGCSNSCTTEVGFVCNGEPSNCTQIIPTLPNNDNKNAAPEIPNSSASSSVSSNKSSSVSVTNTPTGLPTTIQACIYNTDTLLYWDEESQRCETSRQECSDPDSLGEEGDDILMQSSTFGFNANSPDPFTKRIRNEETDFCITDTTLVEYSCDGYYLNENVITCPSGSCSEGRCTENDTEDSILPKPHTKISSVVNGNGASVSYSIPWRNNSTIGRFSFSTDANDDTSASQSTAAIDNIIFTVDALNLSMYSDHMKIYNTANPSVKSRCDSWGRAGNLIRNSTISNNRHFVSCSGLIDSPVDTSMKAGEEITLALEGSVSNLTLNASRPSTLQVSLQNFTDSSSVYSMKGSHIRWIDTYDNTSQTFDWIDNEYPTVNSTSYRYRQQTQTFY